MGCCEVVCAAGGGGMLTLNCCAGLMSCCGAAVVVGRVCVLMYVLVGMCAKARDGRSICASICCCCCGVMACDDAVE